uniref:Secreted protein n=1 Tax=Rhabditophanes sp. KR3021 TaxID=114890 RepID=A0AC35TSA9_9BILA
MQSTKVLICFLAIAAIAVSAYSSDRNLDQNDINQKEFMTLDVSADEKATKAMFKIISDVLPRLFKLLAKLGPKDEEKRMFAEDDKKAVAEKSGWHLHLDQSQLEMITKELFALIDKITKSPIKAEIKLSGL